MTPSDSELPLLPDDFTPHIGQQIPVAWADGAGTMKLLSVKPLTPHAHRAAPFALVFAAPDGVQLAQGTCRFTHPTRGQLDIFLVPVQGDRGGVVYEAVFN